ncbi:hypothetical protein ACJMK2_011823 [Sinanodonta woodiana]|uniref:Uncharacterized protein n=1 Tax=Sinanodonta woodiana TaxID=1069815 RepID=A0ABD3V971_SINWO
MLNTKKGKKENVGDLEEVEDDASSESESLEPLHENDNKPKRKASRKKLKSVSSQVQCKLDFPPCRVCLGKGSGLHYGVNSCESCKSFFRRCLTRKEEYKCSKESNCPITDRARGNCSGCRFKKCLEVGMSREAACLGRYTLSRRTQTIREAKGGDSATSSSPSTSVFISSDCESENTSQSLSSPIPQVKCPKKEPEPEDSLDLELLDKLMDAMDQIRPFGNIVTEIEIRQRIKEEYDNYVAKAHLFGKLSAVPKDEYAAFFESTGIDIDGRQEFLRQSALSCQPVLNSYISFANIVSGFSSLSLDDQCSLLKASHFEFILLLTYKGYDPDLQMILTETGKAYHIDQAADIFYTRELIDSIFDVCRKIQALELTREETAFLLAITVTFGDRCTLDNSNQVEKIQEKMVCCFRTLLKQTRKENASQCFTKVVDCFIAMRAVNDRYQKEYGIICQDKLVQKEAPIWLALV